MKKYAPNIGSIQYHWSIDISTFSCVKPVVLVIGGMDDEYRSICYNTVKSRAEAHVTIQKIRNFVF